MEKTLESDLQKFLEQVKIGYGWLCELYEMMSPEEKDRENQDDEDDESETQRIPLNHQKKELNIIIMDENFTPKASNFDFDDLTSEQSSRLEKVTFKRIFYHEKDLGIYVLKNKYRSGLGFYSLANEIFCFLMLHSKKILTSSNIFESLKYQTCEDEDNLQSVCDNFWTNFAISFLYLNYFNILILLVCLNKMKEEYIEGKALRSVNPLIDIKTLLKIEDLYQFLEIYDYYDSSGKEMITPQFFACIKGKLPWYMDIMGVIEQNIWSLVDLNINTSYVNFILCVSFFNEQFSLTSGNLAESSPSHIADIKMIFDRYMDEIMGYAMDHFKDFSQLSYVQNSFFYHWRTIFGYVITEQNHMINELFDDKLHTRLTGVFSQLSAIFQKYCEAMRDSSVKDRKKLEEKIKAALLSSKHIGLLALNIPCNSQNRYTQIKLLSEIEELQKEFAEHLKLPYFSGFKDFQ